MKTLTLFGMKFGVMVEKDTPPVVWMSRDIVKRVTTEYIEECDANGRRIKVETTTQQFVGKNTQSTSFEYL